MARSLAKIQEQIAKLQKEADAIQSGVIARIKKEIAQFGLTAEHLFGASEQARGNSGSRAVPKARKLAAGKRSAAEKPAKYADDTGNSWHGVGKRPSWIHAALEAGRSLEEFLVGAKKSPAPVKPKAAPKNRKGAAPAKRADRGASVTKRAAKPSAAKVMKTVVAKRTLAKKPKKSGAPDAAEANNAVESPRV